MKNISLEERVCAIENKAKKLHIRSEITLGIISAMIGTGLVNREGIEKFVKDLTFSDEPDITSLVDTEKNFVLHVLRLINIVEENNKA